MNTKYKITIYDYLYAKGTASKRMYAFCITVKENASLDSPIELIESGWVYSKAETAQKAGEAVAEMLGLEVEEGGVE
jgi:hypothetical protein